jgi:myo-inositol 2-dehydrogenase / D-chiro-inositol 1-dehydrogenase
MSRRNQITDGVGVAVIGCGTIGRLRANILDQHPAVGFLTVCDVDGDRAERLARECGADHWTTDVQESLAMPQVSAAIVTTTEGTHFSPALGAIEAGKHVLVEKPFTIDLADGRKLVESGEDKGLQIYTGFTQRFRRRYASSMEHVLNGYLGQLTTATARIYLARSVGTAVMSRAIGTTPAVNTLTYCIDLLLWYAQGAKVVEVDARASSGRVRETFDVPDSTWGLLQFDDGLLANVGVSWELPEFHPAYVASMEVELFGRIGTLSVKDDHRDVLLVSEQEIPSPYTPEEKVRAAFLGSAMPGDWALGEFLGAMKDETDAFVRSIGTGRPSPMLASGKHGVDVLEVTLAIDRAWQTGQTVTL